MPRTPLQNSIVLIGCRLVDNLLAFLFFAGAARFLGADVFGQFCYAFSIAVLFRSFGDGGLSLLSIREIARRRENTAELAGKMLIIRFALALFLWFLLVGILNVFSMNRSTRTAIFFLTLAFVFILISEVFLDVLRAHEEMHWVTFLTLLHRVLLLLFGLYGLWRGGGLIWLASTYLFVSALHSFINCKFLQYYIKGKLRYSFDWRFMKSVLRQSWAFALSTILGVLNFRLGIYLLSFFSGDVAVGNYGAAHRLVEALIFIPLSITTASFPNFSRLFHISLNQLQRGANAVLKMLFIIALPIALGTTLFARQIILLIFGEGFSHSVIPLQILVWAGFFIFLNCVFMTVLQATDRHRQVAALMAGCVLFHLILNLLLIPLLGEAGAALAALITEVAIGMAFLVAVAQQLNIYPWFQIVLNILMPFNREEISWLKTNGNENFGSDTGL